MPSAKLLSYIVPTALQLVIGKKGKGAVPLRRRQGAHLPHSGH